MSSSARKIEEFVGNKTSTKDDVVLEDLPPIVGHLLEMPLTKGGEALIDPEAVTSMSPHRSETDVTVIRQHDDPYTYFINKPYAVVKNWMRLALADNDE